MEAYDEKMAELTVQIDELREKYDVEKAEYDELNEYFDMIDKDKAIEEEEEKVLSPRGYSVGRVAATPRPRRG